MTLARAVVDRIEGSMLRRVGRLMDRLGWSVPSPEPIAPPVAAATDRPPAPGGAIDRPPASGGAIPDEPPAVPVVAEAPSPPPVDQLTREQVEVLFEDMVRPALQSDGGDIVLMEVKDNDVFVSLTGACQTCPSSIMTMQMGIERLLREEFPHFGQLIRVE